MQENTEAIRVQRRDEELADVLIAISVVAKRLAMKLREEREPDGQDE